MYVRDHPASIGLPETAEGKEEFQLLSGDEVDVLFIDDKKTTVVEVKSIISGYNDFRRGIYQCVKYRAVMNAQLDAVRGRDGVTAALVTEVILPSDLESLAKRLKIVSRCVRVN